MNFNLCCFTGLSTGLLEGDFSRYEKCIFTHWEWSSESYSLHLEHVTCQPCLARPTTNALCPSRTQVISRTHSFIVLSQFFESLYSFFWDQSSLRCAHSCFCEQTPHYWDLLDVGRSHTPAVRHVAVKPKASVMLAFPKVWEGCHLPPLLFDVLEVLANKLDKNKIQNFIYRLPW